MVSRPLPKQPLKSYFGVDTYAGYIKSLSLFSPIDVFDFTPNDGKRPSFSAVILEDGAWLNNFCPEHTVISCLSMAQTDPWRNAVNQTLSFVFYLRKIHTWEMGYLRAIRLPVDIENFKEHRLSIEFTGCQKTKWSIRIYLHVNTQLRRYSGKTF